MNDLDDRIRDGLHSFDEEEDDLVKDVLVTRFRGRLRKAAIIAWLSICIYTAAAVYLGYRIASSHSTREMVLCGAFLVIAVTAIMVSKVWYWMLANRNAVQREIKRLEARIVELTERLPQ
jgi:hypothetical protein